MIETPSYRHRALDAENLVRIIHTINFCSEGKTVAVVRVPSAHSDLLTHALDAGSPPPRHPLHHSLLVHFRSLPPKKAVPSLTFCSKHTGAAGIVFPHIDTPAQAAEAVSKCRYACSGGERSLSPCALVAGITDLAPPGSSHTKVADAHVAVICQIESPVRLSPLSPFSCYPIFHLLLLLSALVSSPLPLSLSIERYPTLSHPYPRKSFFFLKKK